MGHIGLLHKLWRWWNNFVPATVFILNKSMKIKYNNDIKWHSLNIHLKQSYPLNVRLLATVRDISQSRKVEPTKSEAKNNSNKIWKLGGNKAPTKWNKAFHTLIWCYLWHSSMTTTSIDSKHPRMVGGGDGETKQKIIGHHMKNNVIDVILRH